MCRHQIYRTKK